MRVTIDLLGENTTPGGSMRHSKVCIVIASDWKERGNPLLTEIAQPALSVAEGVTPFPRNDTPFGAFVLVAPFRGYEDSRSSSLSRARPHRS
jgi:hypothetical protein